LRGAFLLSLMVSFSFQWSYNAHMLTTRIAEHILEKEDPALLERIVNLLKQKTDESNLERDYIFVESSLFADDMKGHGWAF